MKTVTEFFFILTSLLLVFQLVKGSADPDDFRKLTASVRAKCIEETKTTLQAIEDTEFGEFPEDDRLKCYFKCVLEKSSMMDKNGKIKYNLLKKIIPDVYKDVVHGMIDSCTEVTAKDHCEKAYGFMKCLYAENPMFFIAP